MAGHTIPHRLLERAKNQPEVVAIRYKERDVWVDITWKEYAEATQRAARALISLGVEKGSKTCILGFNRFEWVVFDVAAMMVGGIPAGIYETCSSEEVAYIIAHSEAAVVLVENEGQLAKIMKEKEKLPHLKHIVLMRGAISNQDAVYTWENFLLGGERIPEEEVQKRMKSLKESDAATFIYTSGTTGPPKAVMLSHRNLTWTADVSINMLSISENKESGVSYLPLSHIAEQMFTIHAPISVGWSVAFAESKEKLLDNLKEIQPTILFGVPRVWEKFQAGVSSKLKQAKGIKKLILNWARKTATQYHAALNAGKEPSEKLKKRYNRAKKLVFIKLKTALGLVNARYCISGAAPISAEILEFFASLDIPIFEVYGQSEDCGPTSFNQPGKTRYGSVGPPLPGMEIKIAEDGEVLARGPNVFLGYYKEEAATAETLVDGWLLSGDIGYFDDDGFLWITGRKKEIIVTSGGKNISPSNIENALKNIELISQAVVIGDKRNFLTALLTLDKETANDFAEKNGINENDLHKDATIWSEIQAGVDEVNSHFSRVENVRKFQILPRDLTISDGELTPTLKVKRRIVYKNWADVIEEMYASNG